MILYPDKAEVERIYHTFLVNDFPASEVKPLQKILAGIDAGKYFVCTYHTPDNELAAYAFFIYAGDEPNAGSACGLCGCCDNGRNAQSMVSSVTVDNHKIYLLDYLAVTADKRSGGYGSKFLSELKQLVSQEKGQLILEVENPDYAPPGAERDYMVKRIGFYQKNEMQLSGVTCNFYGNEYRILYAGEPTADEIIREKTEYVYRDFFGNEFIDAHCIFHNLN